MSEIAALDLLRPSRNKTPTHDRPGEMFTALDAERFQQCLMAWVAISVKISAPASTADNDGINTSSSRWITLINCRDQAAPQNNSATQSSRLPQLRPVSSMLSKPIGWDSTDPALTRCNPELT